MKLSIIIPVYNTEKYINKCIDSCLKQDLDNTEYEIICVNDGSTDNSLTILKQYEYNHSNIHVFSQSNKKQGAARNHGLSKAKGDFIWFIDSDDWIAENCLKELCNIIYNKKLDILLFNRFNQTNQILYTQENINSGKDFLRKVENLSISVPQYIYSHLFLLKNDLLFLENLVHEDNEFVPKSLFFASQILYYNKCFYHVRERNDSTTHIVSLQRIFNLIDIAISLQTFKEKQIRDEQDELVFNKQIGICLTAAVRLIGYLKKEEKEKAFSHLNNNKILSKSLYHRNGLIKKIESILLFIDARVYYYSDQFIGIIKKRK